ncbi:MAG: methyltransferase dimerization domain-containing protein [Planctomycetota bacterium]
MTRDMGYINELLWGYRASRILQVANGLDIFTILAGQALSVQRVAEQCNTKLDMTEKLLICCVAMGLLNKDGDKYRNSDLASQYLVKGARLYQGNMIAHSAVVWEFWDKLDEHIRLRPSGPISPAQQHRDFILAMKNSALAWRANMLLATVNLDGRRKLLDVGGGPGTYSIELCRKYPELKATVFELPETFTITERNIFEEDMQDRVWVQQGNWETDDFGSDNDVVLLSNILHGPNSRASMKLQKSYDSMLPGSLLIIQDFVLNDEKTGPVVPALFNIMVGAYSRKELFELIGRAVFENVKVVADNPRNGATWITAEKR